MYCQQDNDCGIILTTRQSIPVCFSLTLSANRYLPDVNKDMFIIQESNTICQMTAQQPESLIKKISPKDMISVFDRFIAHIRNDCSGDTQLQPLRDHIINTAHYARQATGTTGLGEAAYTAGLLHDAGKYTQEFQNYIRSAEKDRPARGTVNHTFAGVRYLMEKYHHPADELTVEDYACEIMAFASGAHHGLFDFCNEKHEYGLKHRMTKPVAYAEAMKNYFIDCVSETELDDHYQKGVRELQAIIQKCCSLENEDTEGEAFFFLSMLSRLMLSAVIEGDRRDTAAFMQMGSYPMTDPDWTVPLQNVEAKLEKLSADNPINQARSIISLKCREQAACDEHLFRLNVPTGSGKTLTSLRFALNYAHYHGKKHIIFTAPLLTILEQNAGVIREYVSCNDMILEHHSNVVEETDNDSELDQRQLLTESWDAPIVITTMVQLLNTLFSGKTSCIRRLHSLCDSVIIIDEVQTVPVRMLTLFNLAVTFLTEICGTCVVLCSATQPCLEKAQHPLLNKARELVPYDADIWKAFIRTEIKDAGIYTLQEIPGFIMDVIKSSDSVLVICNKKDEAAFIYEQLKDTDCDCYHLSTSMCPEHRQQTLNQISASLKNETGKTVCVSTQLIEAGVDISFGSVIRLYAGMDSIVQAAGRCNRNGEKKETAPVYIINCIDEKLPDKLKEIRQGKAATVSLISLYKTDPSLFKNNLISDESIYCYYKNLYNEMAIGAQDFPVEKHPFEKHPSIYELMSKHDLDSDFVMMQALKTAGSLFEVIDVESDAVIVPYGSGSDIIGELCSADSTGDMSRIYSLVREAKPYCVSIYAYQRNKLLESGTITELPHAGVFILNPGFYDQSRGLMIPENNMVLEV